MLSARKQLDVLSAYREVGTYRGAAELCGVTPKTVKRVVERTAATNAVDGTISTTRARSGSNNYEGVRALVADKVKVSRARISAKRLLPLAVAAGYCGSARNFRRLVAQEKQAWRSTHAAQSRRRPAVWTAGEHLVIDWGVLAGLHVFCAVLAFSRVRFVRFADNERADTTLGLLAECFEQLGGVPQVVLADRMGCLKGGVVADVVVPTPDYVRFAAHYRFRPDFCHARDPESKGIVENLVGYAKRDLMVPLQALRHGEGVGGQSSDEPLSPVMSLTAANEAAAAWCGEVNAQQHSETCAVPAHRLAQVEAPLLAALPSLRPTIGRRETRKVDKLSCVRFASARYSVPNRMLGQQVQLQADATTLTVLAPVTGEVLAVHALVAPGGSSVLDEHYGSSRPAAPARKVTPRTAAEKAFCALGPVAEQWLKSAAAAGNTRLGPELEQLADLAAAHGPDALRAALRRAVAFGRWRAADIRSILDAGSGVTQPQPPGDALVIDLPATASRPLEQYSMRALAGTALAGEFR